MRRNVQTLLMLALVPVSSVLAAILMTKVSNNSSFVALVTWALFFIALQSPVFWMRGVQDSCTAWIGRLFRRG